MNYSHINMTTAALQASTASISLPPISSIDFHTHVAHRSSPEVVQPLPPPPPAAPRVLPPLPYPYAGRPAPPPPPPPPVLHDYLQARPIYPGIPSNYQPMPARIPLPSTTDRNLIVAPTRHKAKEVKRRTKTGCLTCRKRRIKVSCCAASPFICISCLAHMANSPETNLEMHGPRSSLAATQMGKFTRAPLGDGWVAAHTQLTHDLHGLFPSQSPPPIVQLYCSLHCDRQHHHFRHHTNPTSTSASTFASTTPWFRLHISATQSNKRYQLPPPFLVSRLRAHLSIEYFGHGLTIPVASVFAFRVISRAHANNLIFISQCDEGRPECRNCMKSKRVCQGYDPVFQTQGPHSLHPAPSTSTTTNNPPPSSVPSQPPRYTSNPIDSPIPGHNPSILASSPRDHTEYSFSRPPDQLLPHLNQPYHMDGPSHTSLPPYPPSGRCEYRTHGSSFLGSDWSSVQ